MAKLNLLFLYITFSYVFIDPE